MVWCPHPLLAAAGRELRYEAFRPGESVGAYLRRLGYDFGDREVLLSLSGEVIAREQWDLTYPAAGDLITVRTRVHGGDDEAGGKNPLATILSIALIVIAPYAAPGLATALGVSQAVATGLIVVGGNLLINALLPPTKPNLGNALKESSDSGAGTYSLAGGSNRARRYEPLTRVLGRQRVFPDLGSQPYTEFRGNDQYLIQVFHFGISDDAALLKLSDFRIGDTPISQYQGVEIQESGIDGKLTLFPTNVDTVAGGALTAAAGYVTRTSALDSTALSIDISAILFQVNRTPPDAQFPGTGGETLPTSVVLAAEYRLVGSSTWLPIFDGLNTFTEDYYWSAGNFINNENLPHYADGWVEFWRDEISGAGAYLNGSIAGNIHNGPDEDGYLLFWVWREYSANPEPSRTHFERTNLITLNSRSRTPLRRSYTITVAKGQYEVRVARLTADSTSSDLVSETAWVQLTSYQGDGGPAISYEGQKRVAVSIKASGQLQGTLDQFNAVAETWVPVWTGTQWQREASSNPAWLMYAVLIGGKQGTRRTWGAGVAPARIDLAAFSAFAAWCKAQDLQFNGVFDQRMNCLDMLNAIALTGRGSLSMASGKYGVVWDAPNQPVLQVFGLGNIKADTFAVRWVSEKLGDEIILNFWNRDKSTQDTVRALVPGVTAPANPVQVERFGVDNVEQARREANLIAAAQKYRRRFVTFETDYEGQVVARGDVVALSHDLFAATQLNAWGYSGRLVAGTTTVLTLDRSVVMSAGATNYAAVRFPDGNIYVREVVYASGTPSTLTLASALPSAPDADALNPVIDYVWLFGLDAAGAAKKFKVQDVQPLDDKDVRITLVDENPLYYAAEYGAVDEPEATPLLPRLPSVTNISFAEELIRVGQGLMVRLAIAWDVTGVYDHARVRVWLDGVLAHEGESNGRALEVTLQPSGTAVVEISPVHPLFGAGVRGEATHVLTAYLALPQDVPWISLSGGLISWGAVGGPNVAGYRLRWHYGVNHDFGTAQELATGLVAQTTLALPLYLNGTVTLLVKVVTPAGVESTRAASAAVTLATAPQGLSNMIENWRFANWPGELVQGTLISNRPNADSANLQMWDENESAAMWRYDSDLMWPGATYKEMTYLRTVTLQHWGKKALFTLQPQFEGSWYRIEYRPLGNQYMWSQDSEPMWAADAQTPMWALQLPDGLMPRRMWSDDADLMWSAISSTPMWHTRDGGFVPWLGQMPARAGEYQFRFTTGFGPVRGRLVELQSFVMEIADIEAFNNVVIGAGGTRLPIVNVYVWIAAVSGAAFNDGGDAITFTVEDYDATLGPLIKTRDAAGTPVAGTFTGFIQGYLS